MGLSRRERREQRRKLLKEQRLDQLRAVEEQEKQFKPKYEYKGFLKFYDKQYKKLLFIPFIILLIAIISIALHASATGDFINRGVSLKGGVVITIPVTQPVSADEVEDFLRIRFPVDDIDVRSIAEFGEQKAIIITSDNLELEKDILEAVDERIPGSREVSSVETTGSSLGEEFFNQILKALFVAFIFMGFVVFMYFGDNTSVKIISGVLSLVAGMMMFQSSIIINIIALIIGIGLFVAYAIYSMPSLAAILSVFSDIIVTLAIINILGIKLSTAGIAAFLMLIGYSIDTDILLSTRVLKRKEGTVFQRVLSAAKTGLTMNVTTLVAVVIALVLSQSETIRQIMIILLIGLIVDIVNTWLQNTGLLRYYVEHRKAKPTKAKVFESFEE